jgi:hypothetical protein
MIDRLIDWLHGGEMKLLNWSSIKSLFNSFMWWWEVEGIGYTLLLFWMCYTLLMAHIPPIHLWVDLLLERIGQENLSICHIDWNWEWYIYYCLLECASSIWIAKLLERERERDTHTHTHTHSWMMIIKRPHLVPQLWTKLFLFHLNPIKLS